MPQYYIAMQVGLRGGNSGGRRFEIPIITYPNIRFLCDMRGPGGGGWGGGDGWRRWVGRGAGVERIG